MIPYQVLHVSPNSSLWAYLRPDGSCAYNHMFIITDEKTRYWLVARDIDDWHVYYKAESLAEIDMVLLTMNIDALTHSS